MEDDISQGNTEYDQEERRPLNSKLRNEDSIEQSKAIKRRKNEEVREDAEFIDTTLDEPGELPLIPVMNVKDQNSLQRKLHKKLQFMRIYPESKMKILKSINILPKFASSYFMLPKDEGREIDTEDTSDFGREVGIRRRIYRNMLPHTDISSNSAQLIEPQMKPQMTTNTDTVVDPGKSGLKDYPEFERTKNGEEYIARNVENKNFLEYLHSLHKGAGGIKKQNKQLPKKFAIRLYVQGKEHLYDPELGISRRPSLKKTNERDLEPLQLNFIRNVAPRGYSIPQENNVISSTRGSSENWKPTGNYIIDIARASSSASHRENAPIERDGTEGSRNADIRTKLDPVSYTTRERDGDRKSIDRARDGDNNNDEIPLHYRLKMGGMEGKSFGGNIYNNEHIDFIQRRKYPSTLNYDNSAARKAYEIELKENEDAEKLMRISQNPSMISRATLSSDVNARNILLEDKRQFRRLKDKYERSDEVWQKKEREDRDNRFNNTGTFVLRTSSGYKWTNTPLSGVDDPLPVRRDDDNENMERLQLLSRRYIMPLAMFDKDLPANKVDEAKHVEIRSILERMNLVPRAVLGRNKEESTTDIADFADMDINKKHELEIVTGIKPPYTHTITEDDKETPTIFPDVAEPTYNTTVDGDPSKEQSNRNTVSNDNLTVVNMENSEVNIHIDGNMTSERQPVTNTTSDSSEISGSLVTPITSQNTVTRETEKTTETSEERGIKKTAESRLTATVDEQKSNVSKENPATTSNSGYWNLDKTITLGMTVAHGGQKNKEAMNNATITEYPEDINLTERIGVEPKADSDESKYNETAENANRRLHHVDGNHTTVTDMGQTADPNEHNETTDSMTTAVYAEVNKPKEPEESALPADLDEEKHNETMSSTTEAKYPEDINLTESIGVEPKADSDESKYNETAENANRRLHHEDGNHTTVTDMGQTADPNEHNETTDSMTTAEYAVANKPKEPEESALPAILDEEKHNETMSSTTEAKYPEDINLTESIGVEPNADSDESKYNETAENANRRLYHEDGNHTTVTDMGQTADPNEHNETTDSMTTAEYAAANKPKEPEESALPADLDEEKHNETMSSTTEAKYPEDINLTESIGVEPKADSDESKYNETAENANRRLHHEDGNHTTVTDMGETADPNEHNETTDSMTTAEYAEVNKPKEPEESALAADLDEEKHNETMSSTTEAKYPEDINLTESIGVEPKADSDESKHNETAENANRRLYHEDRNQTAITEVGETADSKEHNETSDNKNMTTTEYAEVNKLKELEESVLPADLQKHNETEKNIVYSEYKKMNKNLASAQILGPHENKYNKTMNNMTRTVYPSKMTLNRPGEKLEQSLGSDEKQHTQATEEIAGVQPVEEKVDESTGKSIPEVHKNKYKRIQHLEQKQSQLIEASDKKKMQFKKVLDLREIKLRNALTTKVEAIMGQYRKQREKLEQNKGIQNISRLNEVDGGQQSVKHVKNSLSGGDAIDATSEKSENIMLTNKENIKENTKPNSSKNGASKIPIIESMPNPFADIGSIPNGYMF